MHSYCISITKFIISKLKGKRKMNVKLPQCRRRHQCPFQTGASSLREQADPSVGNHLNGCGIDVPINFRQRHIKVSNNLQLIG